MPPKVISHPRSSYDQPVKVPSEEWYGNKDLCMPGSLCIMSIDLTSSCARLRSYKQIRIIAEGMKIILLWCYPSAFVRSRSLEWQLFSFVSPNWGWPEQVWHRTSKQLFWLLRAERRLMTDLEFLVVSWKSWSDGRHTKRWICNNQNSLLFAILSQIFLWQTWMYFNLVDRRHNLDIGEQNLQSFDRKVGYTDRLYFPRFEQFLHFLVCLDICRWFIWFAYAKKVCVSNWFWLIYTIKTKWNCIEGVNRRTDLQ